VRVVFLASGAFAIPSLEALVGAGHEVTALVTQPDRESGRGKALAPPRVKPVAERHGIQVLQLARVRAPEAQALLPRLRGAAPIQWAIANGDTETGVTTMQIDEGLDTGPLLLSRATPIGSDETAAELEPRLARLGGELLVETLAGLASGTLEPVPQDASRATLAPLLTKQHGRVDWSLPARSIACRARGFHPWPGAFTQHDGRLLKLLRVREAAPGQASREPGLVTLVDGEGIAVACGEGTLLRLEEVQPESRRAMPASAWAQGARLRPGARLG
jgi:methionyl-tRNA formyltransferase